MRPLINYNRKTGLFDAVLISEGDSPITIASGSSYLAADTSAKTYLLRVLAQLITMLKFPEPTPPAAPAAAKPKRPKKTKAGCICPTCRCVGPTAGIFYCSEGREWYVFDNDIFVGCFPKKERLAAEEALKNARYERLRRAA